MPSHERSAEVSVFADRVLTIHDLGHRETWERIARCKRPLHSARFEAVESFLGIVVNGCDAAAQELN